jgi:large-conductance mechanosensitive channel
MQWKQWLLFILALLNCSITGSNALLSQKTLYDYNNRVLYIHLYHQSNDSSYNELYKIPFNSKFSSGNTISNSTIASPPSNLCEIVVTSLSLYSFCPSLSSSSNININNNYNNTLLINQYDPILNKWLPINLHSSIQYLNNSSYLFTNSDPSAIYIFSGLYNNTKSSNQMLRVDLNSLLISDASSRIQPSPFYKSTSLQINTNTQALFGGISNTNSFVSMMEIPLWQYNSWAERPCESLNNIEIQPRINSLVFPVFSLSNQYILNNTLTNFEVSSVLVIGGTNNNNNIATPQIVSLNTSTNVWQWNDLSTTLQTSNLNNNNGNNQTLSIDDILVAGVIYDTLLTITPSNLGLHKKSDNPLSDSIIKLYNATTLEFIQEIDYSDLNNLLTTNKIVIHTNQKTIIAISVIIPILVLIIIATLIFWLVKKYKAKKEEERNEKEIKEIVDFYENQHKQNSNLTFSTSDSDCKSNSSFYDFDNILINNYDDDDNLSINSWRKKRNEFEQQQRSIFNLTKSRSPKKSSISNNLIRSLSVASNFIQNSLSRKNSTQSSIATFITANNSIKEIINQNNPSFNKQPDDLSKFNSNKNFHSSNEVNENPFHSSDLSAVYSDNNSIISLPPPSVPKHSQLFMFPNRTNSTLHHIPENASISTFHSQTLGFIPMKQAYCLNSSPQKNYMKQISKNNSNTLTYSSSSSSNSSSIYSYSHSHSSPNKSPKIPLSLISTSSTFSTFMTPGSNSIPMNFTNIPPLIEHENENEEMQDPQLKNTDIDDANDFGSINDNELNNIEVQVLVGSKRRSKLRVVNPDIEDQDFDTSSIQIEEKNRVSSSSSEKSCESGNIRKRVISDEHDKESSIKN